MNDKEDGSREDAKDAKEESGSQVAQKQNANAALVWAVALELMSKEAGLPGTGRGPKKGGENFTRSIHEESKARRKMAKKSRRINRGK